MTSENDESLISGGWERVGDHMVPDATLLRIREMIVSKLERMADAEGGWETLFRDRTNGRLWERFYPLGEMHGGGPESLRRIELNAAEQKYGSSWGGRTRERTA
jgi:Immunity protein 27